MVRRKKGTKNRQSLSKKILCRSCTSRKNRSDSAFLAGIEGVIDGFFDGGEQGFAWIIEAEEVSVLGEELADGYFLLGLCHVLGGGSAFA
jgi:hypothetical protein